MLVVFAIFKLQWGRSKFAAEKNQNHNRRRDQADASMGPQQIRCGKGAAGGERRQPSVASMGPQQIRCGKSAASGSILTARLASMGPQQIRCGKFHEVTLAPALKR